MPRITWESQISDDGVLPLLSVAHERNVNIQHQEGHTGQEGDHADADGIVTRWIILVKDALCLSAVGCVDVSLCGDAGEHHQGKDLYTQRKGEDKWMVKDLLYIIFKAFNDLHRCKKSLS